MYVQLFDSSRDWYLPTFVPIPEPTEENNADSEAWRDATYSFTVSGVIYVSTDFESYQLVFPMVLGAPLGALVDPDYALYDITVSGPGDFTIRGGALPDTIRAGAGNDYLVDDITGGPSNVWDSLYGAAGNDTYVVHKSTTRISEKGLDEYGDPSGPDAGGIDTVISYIDYSLVEDTVDYMLRGDIENLTLMGSAKVGRGNDLDNVIKGNDIANRLYGGSGNDTIDGGGGIDFIMGGDQDDRLTGGAGPDIFAFVLDPDVATGHDLITDFANGDVILTTAKFFDSNNDGIVQAGGNSRFNMNDGASLKLTNPAGKAVTQIEYDGSITVDGQQLFVYSAYNSKGTMAFVQEKMGDILLA